MDPKQLLKEHIAKTAKLSDNEHDDFFNYFTAKSYKKGEYIITAGDRVDCEYFVLSGCIKTFYINDNLKMFVLQFAMPACWASDYSALYNREKATIGVGCITDTEVLCLSNNAREEACKRIPQVEHFFRARMTGEYVASQKRLLSTMNNNVKYRYEELITLFPELYNMVPKRLIAAYLGVSRETLSRLHNP
ncbi:Crp/Fnr family transcriptional regulator [Chitinophaga sp. OAE865]|uniref:Crp/Fnr family transcriptional regulator n=1 Tax=Chitinophaga sp. OAE865 TaxID=2817898 RepID=UPI001AEAD4FD